jgi:hypothetical protein
MRHEALGSRGALPTTGGARRSPFRRRARSGGAPPHARDRDHPSTGRAFHGARGGRVPRQREMRSHLVVATEVCGQDSAQVSLPQDDRVVREVPADRADMALDMGMLPRGARARGGLPGCPCAARGGGTRPRRSYLGHQDGAPRRREPRQAVPRDPVPSAEPAPQHPALAKRQLLPEGEILQGRPPPVSHEPAHEQIQRPETRRVGGWQRVDATAPEYGRGLPEVRGITGRMYFSARTGDVRPRENGRRGRGYFFGLPRACMRVRHS